MGNTNILLDFYNLKIALLNSISQLVVMLGLFGKLSGIQIVLLSFFYNFGWTLNFFALVNILNKSSDSRFFDDYQIASVYLFASLFGLFGTLVLKKPPRTDAVCHSEHSAVFALLGSFFVFFTFSGTSLLFSSKISSPSSSRNFVWQ